MSGPEDAAGAPPCDGVTDGAVEAFLRANPEWLASRPALYRLLAPPARVHGEGLADHMAAMLRAERAESLHLRAEAERVLEAGRADASLAGRVQGAVLALMRAADPFECVAMELPALLGVDAAWLCGEGEWRPFLRRLPAGRVSELLGGRAVVLRESAADARAVHAEAAPLARHDALVRVARRGVPLLLALASREAAPLRPGRALGFLGEALAAALERAPLPAAAGG